MSGQEILRSLCSTIYLSGRIVTKEAEVLKNTYGKADQFLKFIQDLEVTHIELRH